MIEKLQNIDPFDVVSGKVVIKNTAIFWFKGPGINLRQYGWPILENLHREDGPAVIDEAEGRIYWYKNGKKHREDGPAAILSGVEEWWYEGIYYGDKGFPWLQYT